MFSLEQICQIRNRRDDISCVLWTLLGPIYFYIIHNKSSNDILKCKLHHLLGYGKRIYFTGMHSIMVWKQFDRTTRVKLLKRPTAFRDHLSLSTTVNSTRSTIRIKIQSVLRDHLNEETTFRPYTEQPLKTGLTIIYLYLGNVNQSHLG